MPEPRAILADFLLSARGCYDTPHEEADALIRRLWREGLEISRMAAPRRVPTFDGGTRDAFGPDDKGDLL